MIKRPALVVMIAEAECLNWVLGNNGYSPQKNTVNGEDNWLGGIAARHGKIKGNHGSTNIAFFDGHVTLMDTKPISTYIDSSGQGGATVLPQSLGVVFTISRRGRFLVFPVVVIWADTLISDAVDSLHRKDR
jgi:prepilin-type processing-associated H-X9-DG protein